jgi:tetratricopeptide (TPR) repeat protein
MSGGKRPEHGNGALRALLDQAGVSNAGLARAVVQAGAEEGVHLGTTPTSVKRMLDGAQPRWPVPRLVAKVLSRCLQQEVTVTECGFADRSPATGDPHDGLRSAGCLDGTIRTVVELSGRDVKRRQFLLGSAFAATAFSEPALFAMTAPQAEGAAREAGRRVGMADVEILSDTIDHLRRLDHRHGSGRVREQLVQVLHRESNTVIHGSYSTKTGRALLGAVSQACWLAGSMAADIGRHSLAQRYYIQTLNLAMSAGDRGYAANVLSHMSRLTVQIGQAATSEASRARHARQAVALARAGHSVVNSDATPALRALLHAVEARGHALHGDVSATRAAVVEAERSYERRSPGSEPGWLAFYTPAELSADLGRSLRDTGEPAQATKLIERALDEYEPWRVRSRCFVQTDLAAAYLLRGDDERAASLGRQALRTAPDVSSTRTVDKLRTLHRAVRPKRGRSRHLTDLDDQLAAFLTQPTRTREDKLH